MDDNNLAQAGGSSAQGAAEQDDANQDDANQGGANQDGADHGADEQDDAEQDADEQDDDEQDADDQGAVNQNVLNAVGVQAQGNAAGAVAQQAPLPQAVVAGNAAGGPQNAVAGAQNAVAGGAQNAPAAQPIRSLEPGEIKEILRAKVCEQCPNYSKNYENECELMFRVLSFINYEGGNEYQLAIAGWSGTDYKNVIFCECCYAYAIDVEESDNALILHALRSPHCEFLKGVKISDDVKNDVDTQDMLKRCWRESLNY